MQKIEQYNRKAFLLPNHISSMACVHSKIYYEPRREYQVRIHDCNHGIKLWGKLENEDDYKLAIAKMDALIQEVRYMKFALTDEMEHYLNSIHNEQS